MAAPRHVLTLTDEGRRELRRRLAESVRARHHRREPLVHGAAVPAAPGRPARPRRPCCGAGWPSCEEPASFFYEGDRPLRAEELDDPFRRGVLTIARATSRAELSWLRRTLDTLRAGDES